jgi:hypothetical protein
MWVAYFKNIDAGGRNPHFKHDSLGPHAPIGQETSKAGEVGASHPFEHSKLTPLIITNSKHIAYRQKKRPCGGEAKDQHTKYTGTEKKTTRGKA